MVEILEGEEEHEESKDVIRLNDVWTVQDKPHKNKGRYMFEVSMGEGEGRDHLGECLGRKGGHGGGA